MLYLIGAVFFCMLLASLVMPWVHNSRIRQLRNEVLHLRHQVALLLSQARSQGADVSKEAPVPAPAVSPERAQWQSATVYKEQVQKTAPVKTAASVKKSISFEQQFGARLPVWIGGIALALAGFYMVKYSIETGLLSPAVRVVLGAIFGAGLIAAAHWVGSRSVANGRRIAQTLAGAGIADLYVCVFAATSLYHLIPEFVGFSGMAMVTATAVYLSLRHGAPIALMGLVGGFLTPMLVGSREPNAPLLFIYLYFVITGLLAVIRRKNWWLLAIPTVLGAFAWVMLWLMGSYNAADGIWLGLFLIAVSATVAYQSRQALEDDAAANVREPQTSYLLNYLTLGGAVLLMAFVAFKSQFGFMEWGLFGLLATGGMVLAYFNPKVYGFVPCLSMVTNAVMLLAWSAEPLLLAKTTLAFAALYCVGGYFAIWRSRASVLWAGLMAATALGYYLLAYYRLQYDFVSYPQEMSGFPAWGLLALTLALAMVQMVKEATLKYVGSAKEKHIVLAIFTVAATAFLSIGMTIELKREFLSLAFAAQMMAVCWINTKTDIKALRPIAAVLACVFGALLFPQIVLLVQLTVFSLVEQQLHLQESLPIVNWPLFQLGLPALMFMGASILLRREKDDALVRWLEVSAIALIGVMGYYLTRHAFHANENILFIKAGFAERGVITNVIFLYGLACLWVGRVFGRRAVSMSGVALAGIALFRIAYFDLLVYNPLWAYQRVGEMPLLNGLLLPYGLPALWLIQANKELVSLGKENYLRYTGAFLLTLVFTLISLNIRHFYHGEFLNDGITSSAEIYTYSVIWLLLGVALLLVGTARKSKMVRIASLAVMILTVGKVFLYDASELTGLLRVFSFLGLGLSLIALSWFYTRFIFGSQRNDRR